MSQIELKVGDTFTFGTGHETHTIKITKLSTQDVDFLVSGANVVNPDKPRSMPIMAFAKWLKQVKK